MNRFVFYVYQYIYIFKKIFEIVCLNLAWEYFGLDLIKPNKLAFNSLHIITCSNVSIETIQSWPCDYVIFNMLELFSK